MKDRGFTIVAVLGQSNASGTTTDHEPDGLDARAPRILTFPATGPHAGTIVPAREPLAPLGGTGFARHGGYPGLWKVDHQVPGVPRLYDLAVAQLRAAITATGPDSEVAAILWHQGESDGGRSATEYAADLDELVTALRRDVPEATSAPFLVGQLAAERLAAYPDHAGVDEAHRTVADRLPRTAFAPAPPPGFMGDGTTHFNAAGQRLLGASYFRAWCEVTGQHTGLREPGGDELRHGARP